MNPLAILLTAVLAIFIITMVIAKYLLDQDYYNTDHQSPDNLKITLINCEFLSDRYTIKRGK
jgi:hypothetical protein